MSRTASKAGAGGAGGFLKPLRVLIVEHSLPDAELSLAELKKAGLEVRADLVQSSEEFTERLCSNAYDIILADYRLPGWTGLEALALLRNAGKDIPFLLVTGTLGEEAAVECIKQGVTDYVLKGHLTRLPVAVRHALEEKTLREERTRAEQALRESEASFRLLFADNPLPMWVYDVETSRFLQVNDAAVTHYGYSREEFLQMRITDIQPQEDVARLLKVAGGRTPAVPASGWWRHQLRDGRIIDVEIISHKLEFAGREANLVVAQDITERKRVEEALRKSEARYRDLVKNAVYGIYRTKPEAKFLDVNPALVAMLGYDSEEELLSLDLATDLYRHPTARAQLVEEILRLGRVEGREVEWKRKDGSCILVRLSARVVTDALGHPAYFEGIAEDVTERRTLENQLRQIHKFEAIGQLAGGIAHDFNNMIGAILGWAELGQDQTPAESPLHSHFQKIREQAKRAAALTRQLLAFARRQILEPQKINLNQTIAELLILLENVIGKDIELKTVLGPNLGMVRADPSQVEQVLMNLCLNARDALLRGGLLLIETRDVEINEEYCRVHTYARPGRYVLLSVSDNGVGMDAATLEHIFEPFFTTKAPGRGTGLGLATVYGVTKQHGGFVQVYSEAGRGSTFHVYLPVVEGAAKQEDRGEKPKAEPVRGGTETVLVAEDHESVREMACATLAGLGYQVMVAGDGEEAAQMFEAHHERIALVLLDVVMPRLGGWEAYVRICAAKPDVAVLFTTGYSAEVASLSEMVEKGVPVLQKPYSPALLARKVREVLDRAGSAAASSARSSGSSG